MTTEHEDINDRISAYVAERGRDADAEIASLRAELDATRARELVAGAEALRRIAAATPIGHEDVTKGPSTYNWLCYAASLLMAEAATTPATPLEQELITMRAREAKLRAALNSVLPFVATQRMACGGMKCRESWCESCYGDDAEMSAQAGLEAHEMARAALAEGEDTRD